MFPTKLASAIAEQSGLIKALEWEGVYLSGAKVLDAIGQLQSLAVAGISFENSLKVFQEATRERVGGGQLGKYKPINEDQLATIKMIYEVTENDVSGEIIGVLGELAVSAANDKEKIAAIQVMSNIVNDEATGAGNLTYIVNVIKKEVSGANKP